MNRRNQDNIAAIYPIVLFISTGLIWFHVSFATAAQLFFGGLLCWYGSYSSLSCLIYARGSKQLILTVLQIIIAISGYFLLKNANFKLHLFGHEILNYQFAYFSIAMGLVMGILTKPDQWEIDAVQAKGTNLGEIQDPKEAFTSESIDNGYEDAITQHFIRMTRQGKEGYSTAFNQYVMRLDEKSFKELFDALDPRNLKEGVSYKDGAFTTVYYLSRAIKPKASSSSSGPIFLSEEINWHLMFRAFFEEGVDLFDGENELEDFFVSRLNAAKVARKAILDEVQKARKKKIIIGVIVIGLVLFLISNISS